MLENQKSDILADCLQLINIKKLTNVDLRTNSDEADFIKFTSSKKSESSIFFLKLNNNFSSKKSM